MTFLFWAALAITGLVAGPIVAHMLRRGRAKEREFPAAALVPPRTSTARERSRLEDWPLLALRALMVAGLAVLGAAPLVRCERLSLARTAGGSVAVAIVLDDSLSMRSSAKDKSSRFELAQEGALQLLRSARNGDAVAIVLAGHPARIALSPTTDLGAARRALDGMHVSDRSTDIAGAVQLARAALRALPQKDHRLIVLSDLAGEAVPPGVPEASAPLAELAEPAPNCGIAGGQRQGTRVVVTAACTDEGAARSRGVELRASGARDTPKGGPDAGRAPAPGEIVARAELSPRRGEQTLSFQIPKNAGTLDVRLTGADATSHDDSAPVAEDAAAPAVAVVADSEGASARTGGPTVVEQALKALSDAWVVRPFPFVPDDEGGLRSVSALILDDPRGLSPEARSAVMRFLEQGGVAAALLGPRSAVTELGWTLEPFAHGAALWEPLGAVDVDTSTVSWLGAEASSLAGFGKRGRVRLDGLAFDDSRVAGKWTDGVPWLFEREVGRGVAVTVGVPSSLEESDLAVRPGFLALLDHILQTADQRKGSRRTIAGAPWTFPSAKSVSIEGPGGSLPVGSARREPACDPAVAGCSETELRAVPDVLGRYAVHVDGQAETRTVTVDPAEILAEPRRIATPSGQTEVNATEYVAASREVALFLIAVFAAELAVRIVRRWLQRGAPSGASDLAPNP